MQPAPRELPEQTARTDRTAPLAQPVQPEQQVPRAIKATLDLKAPKVMLELPERLVQQVPRALPERTARMEQTVQLVLPGPRERRGPRAIRATQELKARKVMREQLVQLVPLALPEQTVRTARLVPQALPEPREQPV